MLRIQWPNGTSQIEFATQLDSTFEAEQRLKASCPFLFTWNGERFVFVADFMWITPLGMFINAQDNGRLGQTTEWIKIRGDQLVPRDGYYDMRVNANLWETHFFDHLSLVAVDHPADTEMFVDERFSPAAGRTGDADHLAAATDRQSRPIRTARMSPIWSLPSTAATSTISSVAPIKAWQKTIGSRSSCRTTKTSHH